MAHLCAHGIIIPPLLIEMQVKQVVVYRYNIFNTTLIIYDLRNRKKDDRRPVLFHTGRQRHAHLLAVACAQLFYNHCCNYWIVMETCEYQDD